MILPILGQMWMEPSLFIFQGSGISFVLAALSERVMPNFIIGMTAVELVDN